MSGLFAISAFFAAWFAYMGFLGIQFAFEVAGNVRDAVFG